MSTIKISWLGIQDIWSYIRVKCTYPNFSKDYQRHCPKAVDWQTSQQSDYGERI